MFEKFKETLLIMFENSIAGFRTLLGNFPGEAFEGFFSGVAEGFFSGFFAGEVIRIKHYQKTVDERIARLDQIKTELNGAIEAVSALQVEAQDNKKRAENLRQTVEQLKQDKTTAETLLKVPEESFARMLVRANSKARIRGIIEGIVIGFTTGALSSLLIWYLTK